MAFGMKVTCERSGELRVKMWKEKYLNSGGVSAVRASGMIQVI